MGIADMSLTHLLVVALAILVCFLIAGFFVFRSDDEVRRVQRRRSAIVSPYMPTEIQTESAARLSVALPSASFLNTLKLFIGMDPGRQDPYPFNLFLIVAAGVVVGWVVRWLMHGLCGIYAWIFVPLSALFIVRSVYTGIDAKRSAALYRQFPDALATIVRAVRVGIPVSEAIRAVAHDADFPTSLEFGRLHDQVGIGAPLEDALREMAQRNRLPEYRFFATALALQSQTGGGLTETLENLADVVRKRVALKARGYALAAEARTSAAILTALPILSGLALAVMNPEYIRPLMEEGAGQTLFGVAVLWLALGIMVMRSMIRKSLA